MDDRQETTLSARITQAREASGLSRTALSRGLGLGPGTLAKWEAGRSEPGTYKLNRLAGMTGVSLVWLLGGEGDGPEASPDSSEVSLAAVARDLAHARAMSRQVQDRIARAEALIAQLRQVENS